MRLPKTSRSYNTAIEETPIGKGDYIIGGATSPAFLDLDGARHRRPVVFGLVTDSPADYPESASSIFPDERKDLEGWSASWAKFGIDGLYLKLSNQSSVELVKGISDSTKLPIMVSASTDALKAISEIEDTRIILKCETEQQSLDVSCFSGNHIVAAMCGNAPGELCERMSDNGAKHIIADFGCGAMDGNMSSLRKKMEDYRMDGLEGKPGCNHAIVCDVSKTWDHFSKETSEKKATIHEATVALSMMLSGADVIAVKGPGAADMTRVYGEEMGL